MRARIPAQADVAQLVEHFTRNEGVRGSNPRVGFEPILRARRIGGMSRPLAHLSDEALVLLAARSEESALAELYDRYGRTAYGLALRVLRDERLAEDAVQEGFLAVWRTAARFVPERGKASSWILTLVHRRAVDAVRREQRRRADTLERAPVAQWAVQASKSAASSGKWR